MSISRAEVEKVSLLARLRLSDDELDRMTRQLGDILGYIDLLSELDTEAIEPMAHALDVANVFRDDVGASRAWIGKRPWPTPRTTTASAIWCRPCWAKDSRQWSRDSVSLSRHRAGRAIVTRHEPGN